MSIATYTQHSAISNASPQVLVNCYFKLNVRFVTAKEVNKNTFWERLTVSKTIKQFAIILLF
jgi:hypothetical protein